MSKEQQKTDKVQQGQLQQNSFGKNIDYVLCHIQNLTDPERIHGARIEYHKLMLAEVRFHKKFPEKHAAIQNSSRTSDESSNKDSTLFCVLKSTERQNEKTKESLQEYFVLLDMKRELQRLCQTEVHEEEIQQTLTKLMHKGTHGTGNAFSELNHLCRLKKTLIDRFPEEFHAYEASVAEMKGTHTMKPFPDSHLHQALLKAARENIFGADKAMNNFLYLKKLEDNFYLLSNDENLRQNYDQQVATSNKTLNPTQTQTADKTFETIGEEQTTAENGQKGKKVTSTFYVSADESQQSHTKQISQATNGESAEGSRVSAKPHPKTEDSRPQNESKKQRNGGEKYRTVDENFFTITKTEHDNLVQKIKVQEAKIEELTRRLSSLASEKLVEGNPNIADLSDKNRPTKLGEKFGSLYDDEWSDAFEALNDFGYKNDDDKLNILQRIVEESYKFCTSEATKQMEKLQQTLQHVMVNPFEKSNKQSDNKKEVQSMTIGKTKELATAACDTSSTVCTNKTSSASRDATANVTGSCDKTPQMTGNKSLQLSAGNKQTVQGNKTAIVSVSKTTLQVSNSKAPGEKAATNPDGKFLMFSADKKSQGQNVIGGKTNEMFTSGNSSKNTKPSSANGESKIISEYKDSTSNPVNTKTGKTPAIPDDKQDRSQKVPEGDKMKQQRIPDDKKSAFQLGLRYVKDFRKTMALSSVHALCEHFQTTVVSPQLKWDSKKIPEKMLNYIEKSVELTWLMCVQDPPMYLQWAEKDKPVAHDHFKIYRKAGKVVKISVWPAVFLYRGGPVVSKGYVQAG